MNSWRSIRLAPYRRWLTWVALFGGILATPASAQKTPNQPPTVRFVSPTAGSHIAQGSTVTLAAVAVDPDGYTHHAIFRLDGEIIAEQALNFLVKPDPGLPQHFDASWQASKPGEHQLTVTVFDDQNTTTTASIPTIVDGVSQRPTVSIVARVPVTGEACITCRVAPGVLLLSRSGDTSSQLKVWLKYGGTATYGEDYDKLPDVVEFPAGEASVELTVFGLEDSLVEGPETLVATLHHGIPAIPASYDIDPKRAEAEIVINDNTIYDVPVVSIEATRKQTREPFLCVEPPCPLLPDVEPALFILRRKGGDLKTSLQVPIAFSGSATYGIDYEKARTDIRFPVGETAVEIPITSLADGIAEPTETVIAQILIPPGLPNVPPPYRVTQGEAEVIIENLGGKEVPIVSITALEPVTSEGCPVCLVKPGVFEISRTGPTDRALTVSVQYSGTATPGLDFAKLPNSVEIPAGKKSSQLIVVGIDDQLAETQETVVARLEPDPTDIDPPHYFIDSNRSEAKIVINDGPFSGSVPVIGVSVSRNEIAECPAPALCKIAPIDITFSRKAVDLSRPLTVQVQWGGTAIYGVDYQVFDAKRQISNITFAAGADTVKHQLTSVSDCIAEGTETALIELVPDPSLGPIERYRIDPLAAVAKIQILDGNSEDSGLPLIRIAATKTTPELCPPNAFCAPLEFFLRRTGGNIAQPLAVNLEFSGTAKPGVDYAKPNQTVTFAAGESTARITYELIDDTLKEDDEMVTATLVCSDVATPTYSILESESEATVTIVDNDNAIAAASIQIIEPKENAVYTDPSEIQFTAVAVDPAGVISTVQFIEDDKILGESSLVFIVEPAPGTPIQHTFTWNKPPAGTHKIVAVGKTQQGQRVDSPATVFRVIYTSVSRPTISVKAGVTDTQEAPPGAKLLPVPATFVLHRTGPTANALRVVYTVAGSAKNGRDYTFLDGDATFASGESERTIAVAPIADGLPEGDETVELTLVPQDTYIVGRPATATVVIHDASGSPVGKVDWLEPKNASVFEFGQEILLKVTTHDPLGYAFNVDFYSNEKLIESVPLIICLGLNCGPKPGEVVEFSYVWKNAPVGTHSLMAIAQSHSGNKFSSAALKVTVNRPGTASSVVRDLPESYEPGIAFTVALKSTPNSNSQSHAIEERPPRGWTVQKISDGGVLDVAKGVVKFGPYLDAKARSLEYSVVPPASAVGKAVFEGVASFDGRSSAIGGDTTLIDGKPIQHPADADSKPWSMGLDEVTAYGTAWKLGRDWPVGPNPIPLDYVTRAGALWRGGEVYTCDRTLGPPPLCWANPGAEKDPVKLPDLDLPPADLAAAIAKLRALQSFLSTSVESVGNVSKLLVRALPGAGVKTHAIEVSLPSGAAASKISEGGVYDAARNNIRWGPFADGDSRELTAELNSTAAGLNAILSADGHSVSAPVLAAQSGLAHRSRISEVRRLLDGSVQLLAVDTAGCAIEFSDDLVNWHRLTSAAPGSNCQVVHDSDANESDHRFYRTVGSP